MQNCESCKIKIRGSKRRCPLCGRNLAGEPRPEEAAYPVIHYKVSKLSFIKVASFCVVVLVILMSIVKYLGGSEMIWPLVVIIWAPILLLDMIMSFYYRHNVLKLISWQFYLGMIVCVIVDRRMTGFHAWSVTWLLPAGFVGLALVIIIIGLALRMMLMDYIIYLAWAVVLSFCQMIFIKIGWNPFPLPAIISTSIMAILGAAGLLFFFRELKSAATRRYHI